MRSEWARLRAEGCAPVWAPASQESSHVGHAGVGVVSMKGAPLSLPTFATAQFQRFFDCGRAVRCIWWFYMDTRVLITMLSSLL